MSYSPNFRGTQSNGSSRQVITNYTSSSGSAIPQGMAVYANTSGHILPVDPTNQTSVGAMVGYANIRIPSTASGGVISSGRLENITTSFSVGDALYVGLDGNPINVKPDYGVAGFSVGDSVIFIGVLVNNEFNPAQTDLQLFTQVIGQL